MDIVGSARKIVNCKFKHLDIGKSSSIIQFQQRQRVVDAEISSINMQILI